MRVLLITAVLAVLVCASTALAAAPKAKKHHLTRATAAVHLLPVKRYTFSYTTHDGKTSFAIVLLPEWYGKNRHPAIPLIISPHGRGISADDNCRIWGDLATRGGFAVVCPQGEGRKLQLYSWGYRGQISDLARMPQLAIRSIPYLQVNLRRIYAVGGSMGGQETLLLLAEHPHLLAGAIAFDPATDMTRRYYAFSDISGGSGDQAKARIEFGGTPQQVPQAYADRSPINFVRQLAFSKVPFQLWWSSRDQIITDQADESARLYQEIRMLNPAAPVEPYFGHWRHTAEMLEGAQLPAALARIGLMPLEWLISNSALNQQQATNSKLIEQEVAKKAAATYLSDQQVNDQVNQAGAAEDRLIADRERSISRIWRQGFYGLLAAALAIVALLLLTLIALRHRVKRLQRQVTRDPVRLLRS